MKRPHIREMNEYTVNNSLVQEVPASLAVLVCDAQELSRAGLRAVIDAAPDLRVDGEVASSAEIEWAARRMRPDVVVLELDDRLWESPALLASIALAIPVVAVREFWDRKEAVLALRAGVYGVIGRTDRKQLLLDAVRSAGRKEIFLAPSLTARLVEALVEPAPVDGVAYQRVELLTERERRILQLIAVGMSTNEVALEVGISGATVKSHVSHMLGKLGLRDRVQAVVLAYRLGLVEV
jgi:DNA-binding NarL/FixJ family response regulator